MNYLFTLCGRAGSKGCRNKNIKQFLGNPLVYYSIAAIALYVEEYRGDDRIDVVLNTDSEELISLVENQDMVEIAIIRRSEELSGDRVAKVSVIKDSLLKAEGRNNVKYDMVIDLDLTSPLRTIDDVKRAIDKKKERAETDAVYSVTEARRNPCFNMFKEVDGFYCKAIATDFVSRQQAPAFFDMNASVYAYEPKALLSKEPKTFFNERCDAIIMKDTGIIDIDSENDFQLMQVIAEYLFKTDDELKKIYEYVINHRK